MCLPFFAAEGGHVTDDLPQALAEACVARCARVGVPLQIFNVEVDRLHRDGVEAAARAAR